MKSKHKGHPHEATAPFCSPSFHNLCILNIYAATCYAFLICHHKEVIRHFFGFCRVRGPAQMAIPCTGSALEYTRKNTGCTPGSGSFLLLSCSLSVLTMESQFSRLHKQTADVNSSLRLFYSGPVEIEAFCCLGCRDHFPQLDFPFLDHILHNFSCVAIVSSVTDLQNQKQTGKGKSFLTFPPIPD